MNLKQIICLTVFACGGDGLNTKITFINQEYL